MNNEKEPGNIEQTPPKLTEATVAASVQRLNEHLQDTLDHDRATDEGMPDVVQIMPDLASDSSR